MLEMSGGLIEKMRYHYEAYTRYKITLHVIGKDPNSREIRIIRDEVMDTILAKTLLAERNADGEIRYLNEKERAAERDKALMSIEAHCE